MYSDIPIGILVCDPCNLPCTIGKIVLFIYVRLSLGIPPWDHNFKVCYLGRLVDCNRSGCDRERDIDWHMSYTVTVRLLNPTLSIYL